MTTAPAESTVPQPADSPQRDAVLAALATEFDYTYAALEPLAAAFTAAIGRDGPPTRDDLASLRPTIFRTLIEHRDFLAGAGVFTVPGLLPDAWYALEWWWTRASGTPEALRVNLDPTAPDFFDYTSDDWFATPIDTAARHVCGPYVDYACTNEYALTIAVPVKVGHTLVGVAAADVLAATLERRLMPTLLQLPKPALLTNADGRVVISASPDYSPGQRVTVEDTTERRPRPRRTSRTFDWRVLQG